MSKRRERDRVDDELSQIRQEAMEFAGIGLYRFTFDGTVLFMDRGALKVFELEDRYAEPAEVHGKNINELVVYTGPEGTLRKEIRKRKRIRGREWWIQTLEGNVKCVVEDSYLVQAQETGEEAIQVVIRDVTEQKHADEALRASERRFRETLENVRLIAAQTDPEGRITFCNDHLLALTGRTREEVMGREWFDVFVPAEMRDELKQVFFGEAGRTGEIPAHFENPIVTRTGERRQVSWSNTVLRDEAERIIGLTCIGEDVTDRKDAEAALERAAEVSERLRALMVTLNAYDALKEMLAPILDTAVAVCRMDGGAVYLIEGEHAGIRCHQGLPEGFVRVVERMPLTLPVVQAVLEGEGPVDISGFAEERTQVYRSHGLHQVYSVALRAGKQALGFLNVAAKRDEPPDPDAVKALGVLALEVGSFLDRLRTEQALRESEEEYRATLDSLADPIHVVDANLQVVLVNKALRELAEELHLDTDLIGRPLFEVFPFLSEGVLKEYRRVMETGERLVTEEHMVIAGREFITETRRIPVLEKGKVIRILTVVHDTTERKKAQAALRDSEELYRELFENANDVVYTHDLSGQFTSLNKAGERITGYTREEALERNALDVVAPEYRELAGERIRRKLAGEDLKQYELEIMAKDGRRIPFEVSTRLILKGGKPVAIQGIARDITERKHAEEERRRLEAQMQHAQKLEGLGVLAGGIAHDFNNLLVGVLGNAGLALNRLPAESPARTYLERIEATAQRAAELTNQMLAYSGKGTFFVHPLNLSTLAKEMGHLLSAAISKKATLTYDCAEGLPLIEGDVAQLHQVIMNLITNASDALGDEAGEITLSTGIMEVDHSYLSETYLDDDLVEGRYVCLQVSDTGCGMDPATQARLFDPFFSTKFAGRGLGLAAVLGIVRGHRGAIKVYSEPGSGTTFKVLFPALSKKGEPAQPEDAAQKDKDMQAWRGSGTILVADDEENVRIVAKEALERQGFTVLTAVDGRDAVEIFRAHADEICVVLLDLTMPVMSGEEAFEHIHAIRPEACVVLSSGFTEQDVASRFPDQGPAAFIQKPYLPSALIQTLRDVIEA